MTPSSSATVLIIGAGLAGLSVALELAPLNCIVFSPVPLGEMCSSAWAQGGIAAALGENDTPKSHARDTIIAGAGLVDTDAVDVLTRLGPQTVRALQALGTPFDVTSDGDFALSREAAHSAARVARVGGDLTGKAVLETLISAARKSTHIEIFEQARARGLMRDENGRVIGAYVQIGNEIRSFRASHVVLATGGIGGLYGLTTNPANLRGEGLGLALLAGAEICDPEFVQFHPTALNTGDDPAPLITEALRGEGAILVTKDGHRFCFDEHPDGELAPRDIVARATFRAHTEKGGAFLDATKAVGTDFPTHFPTVFAACQKAGIDPRIDLIPVAPAEHYHMGGIRTDLYGKSSVAGLWAVGECASTGVHGANRLASNSLLEAAVFGTRLAIALKSEIDVAQSATLITTTPIVQTLPNELKQELRAHMVLECGLIRDAKGLNQLLDRIIAARRQRPLNLSCLAMHAIVKGALLRRESRGAHYRCDYPLPQDPPQHTVIRLDDLAL